MSDGHQLDPKKAYEIAQRLGTATEEPIDSPLYQAPTPRPHYERDLQHFKYIPDPPSSESQQLENYEQRFIYHAALQIARVFGPEIQPIPDAMYGLLPPQQRSSQLFCVVSRSDIRRVDSATIAWPSIQIVVKEIPVVKVISTLNFSTEEYNIWQIIFWRSDIGSYERPVSRGQQVIPLPMVVEFVARYKNAERIG